MKQLIATILLVCLCFSLTTGVQANELTYEYDNEVPLIQPSALDKTGEKLLLSKQRSGHIIENENGIVSGTLLPENSWDYFLFASDADFYSITKLVTSNPNYTMTLGFVDTALGEITLTNYKANANTNYQVNFGAGIYAWVIQSSNQSYGDSYQLQYNMTAAYSDQVLYYSNDLQKLYSLVEQKLRINGQIQNIDFKYDLEWEIPPVGGGQLHWNKLHISLTNPNVQAVHVGGCKYYASSTAYKFDNAILLKLNTGGVFSHEFSQNPPYYNWGNLDAYGNATPRVLDYNDIANYGEQYLIYDLNTDKVVEFVSNLTKPWSAIGDKHNLMTY